MSGPFTPAEERTVSSTVRTAVSDAQAAGFDATARTCVGGRATNVFSNLRPIRGANTPTELHQEVIRRHVGGVCTAAMRDQARTDLFSGYDAFIESASIRSNPAYRAERDQVRQEAHDLVRSFALGSRVAPQLLAATAYAGYVEGRTRPDRVTPAAHALRRLTNSPAIIQEALNACFSNQVPTNPVVTATTGLSADKSCAPVGEALALMDQNVPLASSNVPAGTTPTAAGSLPTLPASTTTAPTAPAQPARRQQ